ncbi:hypothetical protein [Paraburkholderia terrae]|uniref:hypothetical protein n=1 Tax=Paraburkholderia terrae TaxID=311230 RepID=UPI001EE388E7|nr:hypothetical protein [Paraburkholderia terrae]GJH02770.1 hypothetical protein CBA19C8_19455 [Paraburkholderia terrae]
MNVHSWAKSTSFYSDSQHSEHGLGSGISRNAHRSGRIELPRIHNVVLYGNGGLTLWRRGIGSEHHSLRGKMTLVELEKRTGKNILQTGAGVVDASVNALIGGLGGPVTMPSC